MTIQVIEENVVLSDAKELLNGNFSEIQRRLATLEDNLGQIRYGTTAPDEDTGNLGDFYIRSGEPNLFYGPKAVDGSWPSPSEIRGDRGTVHKGSWNSGLAYVKHDAVYYRGSYWYAKTASIGVEPTTDNTTSWGILSQGTFWMGAWVTATMYRVNDVVTRAGNVYISLQNHVASGANLPGTETHWSVMALKGDKGDQGEIGFSILNGTTDPAAGLGRNGDFYLRTDTMRMFGPKTAGAWGAGSLLKGDPGNNGQGVPTGGTAGQVLEKIDGTNFNTAWRTRPFAGGALYKSVAQSLGAAVAADVALTFNSTLWNRGAVSIANNGILIPAGYAGVWEFHIELAITGYAEALSYWQRVMLLLNGTTVDIEDYKSPLGRGTTNTIHLHRSMEVAVGDVINGSHRFIGAENASGTANTVVTLSAGPGVTGTIIRGRYAGA